MKKKKKKYDRDETGPYARFTVCQFADIFLCGAELNTAVAARGQKQRQGGTREEKDGLQAFCAAFHCC